jgi:hypothetical protein
MGGPVSRIPLPAVARTAQALPVLPVLLQWPRWRSLPTSACPCSSCAASLTASVLAPGSRRRSGRCLRAATRGWWCWRWVTLVVAALVLLPCD